MSVFVVIRSPRHRGDSCDEPSCHNPLHWLSGTTADNVADFMARGSVAGSPLTDRRGPRRTRPGDLVGLRTDL